VAATACSRRWIGAVRAAAARTSAVCAETRVALKSFVTDRAHADLQDAQVAVRAARPPGADAAKCGAISRVTA
jgi:hypothetical protein